ncbi:MAG: hypothetical protein IPO23_02295 [Flavobacterium sp.]|nr:hypothetical protein [Flavobacterium sp.]
MSLVAASKVYDATTTAAITGTAALQAATTLALNTSGDGKPIDTDTVSLTGTAVGTYNSKDVATATTVSYSGLSLTGASAANYSLTAHATSAATITAKPITLSGLCNPYRYGGRNL